VNRVAIVGAAQTKHSAALADENHQDLAYRTVKEVLELTGLKQQEIPMVINSGSDILDGRGISTYMMLEALGAQLTEETKVAEDGAYAALYAWMRIASGSYDLALVIAYGKSSESHPHWYHNMILDPFYGQPMGLDLLNCAALQANAYMNRYGASEEQAARVVVKDLRNAKNNPFALRKGDYTLEQVMSSPYLATPIKELDAYPVTDGACALILAGEEKARELTDKPVWIEGLGTCQEAFHLGNRDLARLASAEESAKKAYAMSGITDPVKELDLAEVYADFSFQELMLYEALGFCPEGGGGAFIDSGIPEMGKALPVNPSGGPLAANPLVCTGLVRLAECWLQLTGQAGARQVAGAKKALAHAYIGPCMQNNLVFVLGGE
jgi:acetyl-CoA C-acetyltransferase